VHIAVVDPGVGTQRRALAARIGAQYFIGPDNGLFTPLIADARDAGLETIFVSLEQPRYWLPRVSRTFHGRDIFAPSGAHLAAGVRLEELGRLITDPVLLPLVQPEKITGGYRARISAIDTFGNLATNLAWSRVAGKALLISLKGRLIHGVSSAYGQHPSGELIALVDSEDFIEVAVVNGSAAALLGAQVGDTLEVLFTDAE
jgi:hypothetical protein